MNGYTFIIEGEVAPKKNSRSIVSAGGRMLSIPSKTHAAWHRSAYKQLFFQRRPTTPINQAVKVTCKFTHGDMRKRDHNNQMASVLDLLVDMRIIEDDNWLVVREESCVTDGYVKGCAKCEVVIESLAEKEEIVKK